MGKASRKKTNKVIPLRLDTASNALQKIPRASHDNVLFRSHLPNKEKISHALAELLKSVIHPEAPQAEFSTALDYIAVAWNISLMAPEQQADERQRMSIILAGADEQRQHETRTKLKNLIALKQRRFPQDRRIIASWEVFTQGSTFRVTASATAKPL